MLQILSNLTGFSLNDFEPSEVVKEFSRKYLDTWVEINGKLEQIILVHSNKISTNVNEYYSHEVKSIEVWMPPAGIYHTGINSFVYLYRLPKRQWLKSFSLYNNYHYIDITKTNPGLGIRNLWDFTTLDTDSIDSSRQWLFDKGKVVFKWLEVGEFYEDWVKGIKVTQPLFYQEVLDKWQPQYKISMG